MNITAHLFDLLFKFPTLKINIVSNVKDRSMSREGFAQEIYKVIGSEPMALYNEEGNTVYEPEEAISFFLKKDHIMIQIKENPNVLEISLSDGVDAKEFEHRYGAKLRKLSLNQTYKYMLRTYGRKLMPKDFAENTPVLENMYGSSKSSYQKIGGSKVIIRHSTAVNEEKRGSRTRNIRQVFVETADGERFKIPHQNLHAAKSIAYHLNNEGYFGDPIANKILEIAEKMNELKEIHLNEQDLEKKFWVRAEFLSLRESLKRAYSSKRSYEDFVTKMSPKPLKEAVEFEHWAISIVPSDHLNEEYEENIVSSYLYKVNHATKSTITSIINEMIQLGIADEVVKHLNWPIKSMVTEAIEDQTKMDIDRAWQLKVTEIKRHKMSVKDAIEDIAREFSTAKDYQEVKDYLEGVAEDTGLMPKDSNEKMIDDILSKNRKLRDDMETIKAQEYYGQARFINESEAEDQDREIYDLWLEIMRVVGQGMGHRVAMDQTISQVSAKYKIAREEAAKIVDRALDKFASKG